MNEHIPGEGGAANTPPFPRIDRSDAGPPPEPVPVEPPEPGSSSPREAEDAIPFFEAADHDDEDLENEEDAHFYDDPYDDEEEEDDEPWRSRPDPFSPGFDRPAGDADAPTGPRSSKDDGMSRTDTGSTNRGFDQFADRLDEIAERIDRLANEQLHGSENRERAAVAAQSTATWISDLSDYLRESDLAAIRTDLERQVREHPFRSIVAAVGAGWLLGKIIR